MNNTAKHTPGPWVAVRDEKRNAYAWNIEGAQGTVPQIARLALIDAGAQIEPNAYLIAAAPAMYEALQAIVRQCRQPENKGDSRPFATREEDLAAIAEHALAQAEGR